MEREELRTIQAPLKERYEEEPGAALVTLKASGSLGEGVSCSVDTGRALAEAGLHPASGGDGSLLCSGDMLLEALVACAGVTLRAVSTSLGIAVESGTVRAEGDLDFRGTLAVGREAPVGFAAIRLDFELDTDAGEEELATLLKLTERYCVVFQTLCHRTGAVGRGHHPVGGARMLWPTFVAHWGSTAPERAGRFPCDELIAAPDHTMFRAVDVEAPPDVTFRWLCQLRAAPYSYDKLDNFGRRSPQTLTPGLEDLEPGQRFQTIFRLTGFESGRSVTMLSEGRIFGTRRLHLPRGREGRRPLPDPRQVDRLLSAPSARPVAAPRRPSRRPGDDAPSAAQPEGPGRAHRRRQRVRTKCLNRCDTSASWRRRERRGAPTERDDGQALVELERKPLELPARPGGRMAGGFRLPDDA